MKTLYLLILLALTNLTTAYGQTLLKGRILDADNSKPLTGASIRIKGTTQNTSSDAIGQFAITVPSQNDTLIITYIGYIEQRIGLSKIPTSGELIIRLKENQNNLKEVIVNTGYSSISLDRVPGSFTQIDQKLINRSASSGIISRLEGVTNSLNFDRRQIFREENPINSTKPRLQVRGVNTIYSSTEPLIVVDNFPYEGDINSLNPNDVESITLLKDAAAASIWGARAGNGVLVIITKQGRYNQQPGST